MNSSKKSKIIDFKSRKELNADDFKIEKKEESQKIVIEIKQSKWDKFLNFVAIFVLIDLIF